MGQVFDHALLFVIIWAVCTFLSMGAIMIVYAAFKSMISKDSEEDKVNIDKIAKKVWIIALVIGFIITYSADKLNML